MTDYESEADIGCLIAAQQAHDTVVGFLAIRIKQGILSGRKGSHRGDGDITAAYM